MVLSFLLLAFVLNFVRSQFSAGCGEGSPFLVSQPQQSFVISNGLNRTFNIYIPANYDENIETPLVFLFHAEGGTGKRKDLILQRKLYRYEIFRYHYKKNDNFFSGCS